MRSLFIRCLLILSVVYCYPRRLWVPVDPLKTIRPLVTAVNDELQKNNTVFSAYHELVGIDDAVSSDLVGAVGYKIAFYLGKTNCTRKSDTCLFYKKAVRWILCQS